MTEIISTSCCFGTSIEEVHVNFKDCPSKRDEGARRVFDHPSGELREEATCSYLSIITGVVVPKCEHYMGTRRVKRDGKVDWLVICGA